MTTQMTLNPARVFAFLGLSVCGGLFLEAADHEAITGLLEYPLYFVGAGLIFLAGWVARTALEAPKEADR
ncbi:hypothetical protein [Nocardiopsis alba]|uniref:hypothetical protein n=1 Tax=Nocardiopsis alba TaxID=53437 RepID=UPI00339F1357